MSVHLLCDSCTATGGCTLGPVAGGDHCSGYRPIDQLKMPRIIPGLGDNLLTVARPASWVARVRCQVCGIEVGCRVVQGTIGGERNTMDQFSFMFWLSHFLSEHSDLLPDEVRAEL